MEILSTRFEDVKIIVPRVFSDPRGVFLETFQAKRYRDSGIGCEFVQDNLSYSIKATLRGLHYQRPHTQDKLVYVIKGEVFDVVVDIRRSSPTFGQWEGVCLSAENCRQLYVPAGFAHGFCVLSEEAVFSYKCSDYYAPAAEHGIVWNDPDIGIQWPLENPLLSEKDGRYPRLREIAEAQLPTYREHR
jgi:dTDP-4-dehydrorhamnose 3,5-epimerase